MSNGNLLLNRHPQPIRTATVAIFTPGMRRTLLVFNWKLMAFVPPGGKEDIKDKNSIHHTARRETWEEVGIDLSKTPGDWLGIRGNVISSQKIIRRDYFEFEGNTYLDHLFFYRLTEEHQEIYRAEKVGEWYSKESLQSETIIVDGRAYRVLVPGTREAILRVMK